MIRNIIKSFAALVYPPLCLHCRNALSSEENFLCALCLELMPLIDPVERCPFCFSAHYEPPAFFCAECARRPPLFDRLAATFDYAGPASTLVRKMKYGNLPHLGQGAGAFLAAQFLRLEWPMPDYLIPVPISFMHRMERGYNQSLILCESMSSILQISVADILTRKSGDYSQAALNRQQRMSMDIQTIGLKKRRVEVRDKIILLVDDVMTTGSTMRKCCEALIEDCPSRIYGLVLCRALV